MADTERRITTGGAIGTGLLVLGGVLAALIALWLLVSLAGGGLRAGGLVLGLMLLAVICLPLAGAGWYLRSWGRSEIAEENTYAARREILDSDVTVRRQLVREVEQRLAGLERLISTLPAARRAPIEGALHQLRDVRGTLLRPGYDPTRWLNTGGGIDNDQLANVRRYDDLVLEEANRLAQLEREVEREPDTSERLVRAVEVLAEHLREREQLFGRGRAAAAMRPQELLAAGRAVRWQVSSPLALSLDDAVTYERSDFLVRAVLTYFAGGREWKTYQLHDGKQERWLEVRTSGTQLAWLEQTGAAPAPSAAQTSVEIDGLTFTAGDRGTATVTIEGAAGRQEGVFVEYARLVADGEVLVIEQWPDGPRTLRGATIVQEDLDLWTKPPTTE